MGWGDRRDCGQPRAQETGHGRVAPRARAYTPECGPAHKLLTACGDGAGTQPPGRSESGRKTRPLTESLLIAKQHAGAFAQEQGERKVPGKRGRRCVGVGD